MTKDYGDTLWAVDDVSVYVAKLDNFSWLLLNFKKKKKVSVKMVLF